MSEERTASGKFSGIAGMLLVLAGLLFGGMGVGVLLAQILAPGSLLAEAVGFLVLPLCLGAGMSAWHAAATAAVSRRLLGSIFQAARGKDLHEAVEENLSDLRGQQIPGTGVFLPSSFLISAGAGALIGVLPASIGFLAAFAVLTLTGLCYGVLLRHLARAGILPLPDDA